MKIFKRASAILLVLCLTLSLGILAASAANDTVTYKLNGGEVLEWTKANDSASSNANYRLAMGKYFAKELNAVFVAGHQGSDSTRFQYTTAFALSTSYPTFDNGFQIVYGEGSWAAFMVRNPGNGTYDLSFDYYATPVTANSVEVYAMPASVVTNLITDERGVEFYLTNATVKAAQYMGESTIFGGAIKAAMDNGTAVKLGTVTDMTKTKAEVARVTASLTDNQMTFANGEDMIVVFKTLEKEAETETATSYARHLIYTLNLTPVASAPTEPAPTEPEATEPQPTEPGATEPAPTEPAPTEPGADEPSKTGETAPVMLIGMLMVVSLAAVCVVCKKRTAC